MRNGPVGLLDCQGVVVHAELIGHKRLAEQCPLDRRQELELKELAIAIMDDVRLLEGDPTARVAD